MSEGWSYYQPYQKWAATPTLEADILRTVNARDMRFPAFERGDEGEI